MVIYDMAQTWKQPVVILNIILIALEVIAFIHDCSAFGPSLICDFAAVSGKISERANPHYYLACSGKPFIWSDLPDPERPESPGRALFFPGSE